MRKYYAECDNGHDWSGFNFYSNHRANSKANLEDARLAGIRKYGYNWAKHTRVLSTWLDKSE